MTENHRINVVHICDHLGWPGSRMHGVKRLFSWMLPRFDSSRFQVSLVSLRGPDTSEDTLEAQALSIMNTNKITCLCVHKGNKKNKTIGIIHIHNILKANIS